MSKKHEMLDSEESIFFAKQLEAVKAKTYDIQYAELKGRLVVPVSMDAGPGAESIKYEQFDSVGVAKLLASYADDLPRADVKGKEFISPVKGMGASFGYSVQEVRAARMAGKPLEQRRANAAKRAILQKENDIIMFGDSATGLKGFLNHASVPLVTLPADGTGASILWSTKTADLILRDLNLLCNTIVSATKAVEQPDSLLLPVTAYTFLASTPRSSTSDTTILEYFKLNNPFVKNVGWLNELETAGAGSLRRMVAYKKDSDKLTAEIPQDFEQFPEQERGLEYVVPCHSRVGGVILYYPMSVAYADAF